MKDKKAQAYYTMYNIIWGKLNKLLEENREKIYNMKELHEIGRFRDGGSLLLEDKETKKVYWLDHGIGHLDRGSLLYEGHPNIEKYTKPVYEMFTIVNSEGYKMLYSKLNQEDFEYKNTTNHEDLLKSLWYKRNPSHDKDSLGRDRFWGTVLCVFDDYKKALLEPILVKPFFCGSESNHNLERCKNQCKFCSLEDK